MHSHRGEFAMPSRRSRTHEASPAGLWRLRRRAPWAAGLAVLLATTVGVPLAGAGMPLGGLIEGTLGNPALSSPQELGEGTTTDLLYADVTEGLSQVAAPEVNSGGTAELSYPLELPQGRGMTPELALGYSSSGGPSWAGVGWDLSVGEVAVDTSFGAPRFCDGSAKSPPCGNVESESYTLDGDQLVPNAVRSVLEARVSERQDYSRRVETEFEQIIRHGTKPSDYWWEVRDKKGGVRFYGGTPDAGGPKGLPGTQAGVDDKARKPSDILTDSQGNGVRWMLTAQRDIGVNLFRYVYETVSYQRDTSAATGWSPLGAGVACPSGQACPKHVFLSKILYTAASTASGQPEDPAYEIRFLRTPGGRSDARLDGRSGVLDLDQDLLGAIEVRHIDTDKVVTRYELGYDADPHFGKTRLRSVTQIGCNGLASCPTTGLKHTFDYWDDVATAGSGFGAPATWKTGTQPSSPGGTPGYITEKLSALGASQTNAGDGRIYVGFNPASPSKTGSAGGSFAMNGATNESIIEFMDLNGDGLPDKVYRKTTNLTAEPGSGETMIQYQLNTSTPSTAPTAAVTFGTMHGLEGFSRLPVQRSIGIQGGIEAYFGVYGVFNVGGSWSWVDSYFTDANGDGLPDLVSGTDVLFNHLVCDPNATGVEACLPTFTSSSAQTRVPLTDQTVPVSDASFAAMVDRLREAIPPVDTVRRWTAPFDGTVQIDATATLTTPADTADGGARVTIQQGGTELANSQVTKTSPTWQHTVSRPVTKGESLYFRTGSRPQGNGDVVTWEADITYAGGAALDSNGLDQRAFSLTDDFTLAGRPGLFTAVGNGGTASFGAALNKTAATSDDLLPELLVRSGATGSSAPATITLTPITAAGGDDTARIKTITPQSGQWCVADGTTSFGCFATEAAAQKRVITIGKAEVGRFRITASPTFAAPIVDGNGVVTSYDAVQTRLAVDSPIDLSAITWIEPASLCFQLPDGTCDVTKTAISPHMDIDVYARDDRTAPVSAWTSTLNQTVAPRLVGSLGADNPGGDIVVTVKTAAGFVYKQVVSVASGAQSLDEKLADLTLTNGTAYWFDVSVRNAGVSAHLSGVDLTVEWTEGLLTKSENVPQTLNWAGAQGYFPLAFRGWAAAGYTATGAKATTRIDEAAFTSTTASGDPYEDKDDACHALYGGDCPSDTSVNDTGFGDYPAGSGSPPPMDVDRATAEIPDAFAFRPVVTGTSPALTQRWEGPKAKIFAADDGVTGSARMGEDLPITSGSGGGTTKAPNLLGETGPVFMLMAGIGPLGGSFAAGWTRSLVDYLDMNGDGFPDTVRPGSITYTNARGTQECNDNVGARIACTGGGVGTVNSATTLAVSGGFGGAPIGISGNSKGTTNSTKGGSAGKGQSASDSSWGGNIGGSLGGGATFTNPTSQNEHQDDSALSEVPRDETIPVQETIADINGDGLPDRITVDDDEIFVQLNLGHSFAPKFRWTVSAFSSTNSYSASVGASLGINIDNAGFAAGVSKNANVDLPNVSWDDVNGDGLLDALYSKGGTVKVAFSNGTGLTDADVYGTHQSLDYPIVGPIEAEGEQQIRQDTAESLGGGADVTVGIPLCLVACYLILNPGGHFENSMTSTDVDLTDVNGDGYADTVRRVKDSGDVVVSLNTQGRTGLLKKVTTPMGGTMSLDYHRDGNTTSHPGSRWVVDEVTIDSTRGADGISQRRSTIAYGTPRYDFIQRSDLGYDSVTETQHYQKWNHADLANPATTAQVRTTVHQYRNASVFEAGLEYETTVHDGPASGPAVQGTRTTWELKDLDTGGPGTPYALLNLAGRTVEQLLGTRATAQVAKVEQDWYLGGVVKQTTTTTYAHDRLGNPTDVVDTGLPGTTDDDTVATLTYSDCTSSSSSVLQDLFGCAAGYKAPPAQPSPFWSTTLCQTWVSQPVSITVKDSGGTVLRHREGKAAFCDNASVSFLRELVSAGDVSNAAAFAETRMAYDAYGSYDRIVLPPDADGERYAVHYLYDDVNHANVAETTDHQLLGSGDPAGTDPADLVRPYIGADVRPTGDAVGNTSKALFDGPTGRVKTRIDANGNETHYTYDAYSRLRTVTSPDGGVATFDYYPSDADYPYATVKHTDEFNAGTTIDTATYVDGSGRVTGRKRDAVVYDPATGVTGAGYACEGGSDVDGLGRTVHQWKPFLQTGATLDAYTVDASDPGLDQATLTAYDALDRVVDETLSNRATTKTAYGFEDLDTYGVTATIQVTDPQARLTKTWLDAHDNVLHHRDTTKGGVALDTEYDYDPVGQLVRVDSPGAQTTTHTYDLLGRRTSTTTPDGGLVEWTFDLAGNKVTEQSPVLREENDVVTRFGHDFGLLTSITYPDEPAVTLDYGGYLGKSKAGNAAGRLVHVEDKARVQTLAYDVNGRLAKDETTMTGPHPNTGPFTTTYDNDWLGRLASVSLPDGEVVTNDYDAGARLTKITGTRDCTQLGVLTTAVDALATTITVTEFQHADPASAFSPALPFTVTIGGEALRVTARVAGAVAGTFDYTVERGINGTLEIPTAAPHAAGASVVSDTTIECVYRYLDQQRYDVYGKVSERKLGNGVTDTTYRDVHTRRLDRQTALSPDGLRELQDQRYTYDLVGNVLEMANDLPPDVPSLFGGPTKHTYTYDDRYRLVDAKGIWTYAPKTTRQYEWHATLDDTTSRVNRLTQKDWTSDTGCTKRCKLDVQEATTFDKTGYVYATGKPNQAVQVHDAVTNSTETYEYDSDGEQTKVTNPDTIRDVTWDWAGKMIEIVDHNAKGTGRKQTDYVYDYAGQLATEIKEQGVTYYVNPWVTVRNGTMSKNIWAGNDRLAVKFSDGGGTYEQRLYFLHTDLQGSTTIVTNRDGTVFQHQEYFPGGQVWIKEDSTIFRTPYQFGGGYTDEDHALINFGDRWYSTAQSRFLTVDPILTDDPLAMVANPALTTAYTYGQSNATSYVDTDGRLGERANLDINEVINTISSLTPDGEPIKSKQLTKLANFFADNLDTARGRQSIGWLKNFNKYEKRQKTYFNRLDSRPVLEFEIEDGKLKAVKLGFGVGKRLKFDVAGDAKGDVGAGATPTTASPVQDNQSGGSTASSASSSSSQSQPSSQPAGSSLDGGDDAGSMSSGGGGSGSSAVKPATNDDSES